MSRIRIQYLCDRCSQDVTACADCDKGSRFIENRRGPQVSYASYYDSKAFRAARERVLNSRSVPEIERVIFAEPATIVFWADGVKTVVKCQDGDVYDPELGLAMAISKRAMGNTGNYNNVFKKWLPKSEPIYANAILTDPFDLKAVMDDIKINAPILDGKALVNAIRNLGRKNPLSVEGKTNEDN